MALQRILSWADRQSQGRTAMTQIAGVVDGFEGQEVLKIADDRVVVSGQWHGRDVVIKQFQGEQSNVQVTRMEAELLFLAEHMADGENRMMQVLATYPDHGIAVLEHVPGLRLHDILKTAHAPQRAELIAHAGRWLGSYTKGRQQTGTFAPRRWLERRTLPDVSDMAIDDMALLAEVAKRLKSLRKSVRGVPVTRAAVHGDFTAVNLHYSDGVMYGVDVQGEAWFPLAKDVALFLVWLALSRETDVGERSYGIALDDFAAFLSKPLVPQEEAEILLPFMIGAELRFQFARAYRHSDQRDRLRDALIGWLQDTD